MNKFIQFSTIAIALLSAGSLLASPGSEWYRPSGVNAKLNVTVKPDTDVLYFVRDTADPGVYTKTYVLKHADPYEVRAYLFDIVRVRRIDENDTGVQAVKYNDGTGIVMISAEENRFSDSKIGLGFDSIIKLLDVPKMTYASGSAVYVYKPKYRNAEELRDMIQLVGANNLQTTGKPLMEGDPVEGSVLFRGQDKMKVDTSLNLIFMKTPLFSKKYIERLLAEYDVPYAEVTAKITIYELYAENDTKLGLDFQAWKNNDGVDFFNTGARFMNNFSPKSMAPVKDAGWFDASYFNFNPKWNTKYIDFLTSKGKARVYHTAEVLVRSGDTAVISRTTQVFLAKATKDVADKVYTEEGNTYKLSAAQIANFEATQSHRVVKIVPDNSGEPVYLNVTKLGDAAGSAFNYTLRLEGATFTVDGENVGPKVKVTKFDVNQLGAPLQSQEIRSKRGKIIDVEASDTFGFQMTITPSVCGSSTGLNVTISNSSLIGYTSEGNPRIQKGAKIQTDFSIDNKGSRIVIGGIEKRSVVSVSGGLPILKDLPVLGWIFSTESESTKRSQLVVVAEIVPTQVANGGAIKNEVKEIKDKVEKAGTPFNKVGYHQFLLDPERLK